MDNNGSSGGLFDAGADPRLQYLSLLKRVLTRFHFEDDPFYEELHPGSLKRELAIRLDRKLRRRNLALVQLGKPTDWNLRARGLDWPKSAETMVGVKRLDNLQSSIQTLLRENVPGDLVEAGVWRGGATIFMKAVLEIYGDMTRNLYAADSFRGLPEPSDAFPADSGDRHHEIAYLSVSLETVKENFRKYGVSDERVHFVEGWFQDTLHGLPCENIALLRLDGDMYSSTIHALEALYDRVQPGGFVIVDDYNLVGAHSAVHDFLRVRDESPEIVDIDGSGAYWRRVH